MKIFQDNTSIRLSNGSVATIKEALGQGGQGTVYRVTVNGRDYAMKVYTKMPNRKFIQNLEDNVRKGAPTKHFLWPLWTIQSSRIFGYVMDIRPKEYVEFSKFLVAKARFASWSAMINAAIQITYAFRELHRKGLSYQDLNDGNFFFHPQTGDVLICDNDNVCPPGTNLGIKGKCRYMAPEVVIGNTNPNNLSDYFSLSVVLFMLLFNNHPFDGKRVADIPCLNDAIERHVYGENPIFIFDPGKQQNRPVRGIHTNVINRWPLFPEFVRQAFIEAYPTAQPDHHAQLRQRDVCGYRQDVHHLLQLPEVGGEAAGTQYRQAARSLVPEDEDLCQPDLRYRRPVHRDGGGGR